MLLDFNVYVGIAVAIVAVAARVSAQRWRGVSGAGRRASTARLYPGARYFSQALRARLSAVTPAVMPASTPMLILGSAAFSTAESTT